MKWISILCLIAFASVSVGIERGHGFSRQSLVGVWKVDLRSTVSPYYTKADRKAMRRLRLRMSLDGTCNYYGDGAPETYKWKLHAGVVTFCKPWGGEQESFTLSKDGSSMSDGDTYKGALFRLTYIKTNPSHGATGRSHRSARWPILRRKRRGSIPQSERGVMETHVAASRGAAGNLRSSFSARS